MIEFNCSQCGKTVRVADESAGRQGRCPSCQAVLTIPSAAPSPPPVWPPAMPPPLPPGAGRMPGPPPSKAMPICALVFGCLGVILPILGLVGVVLGIVVLASRRPGKGMAATGVVLGLVLSGASSYFLLRGLGRARELARQSTCMANLKSTSSAIETYKADNKSRTPRLHKWADPAGPLSGDTHADELWQGDDDRRTSALGTAAVQNLWLLISKDLIPEGAFVCPSDGNYVKRPRELRKFGWTSRRQVSYGMHYPYDGPDEGTENPSAWTDHVDGSVAILADQNPASLSNERRGKSVRSSPPAVAPSNHEDDGEAVLLANGSAMFYKGVKDSKCGKDGDDIYVAGRGEVDMPQTYTDDDGNEIRGELDSYIVPTTDK